MEQTIFYQLSIVMALGAGVSLLMRLLHQPLIMGYIITGILVGPTLLDVIHAHEAFESFSQIGITLLLFIIGLGLNVGIIKDTGKPVLMAFFTKIIGVGFLGFGASHILGFNQTESLVLAVALLFSSTIIVIKALSDEKEQSRLHGQIAIGVLLIEDLAATLALVFLSANAGGGDGGDFGLLFGKGMLLASGLIVLGGLVLPHLSKIFASTQELLYIFALAWAFGVASAFHWAGFSIEVGALFAGVSLAHLPYAQAISTRLKPLRDFFIVLFFIGLGEELGLSSLSDALVPAVIFSAIIMICSPLLVLISLGSLRYTKQTSFKTAVHLSQVSEFSIVFVVLAYTTGLVGSDLVSIITLTALITIALSAYLMKYDDQLFRLLQKPLGLFERAETKRELQALGHYPLVLVGYREGGYSFVKTFRQMKKRYVVIDYDPDVIEHLERQHINHLYADVTDEELLEEIGLRRSEMIISTLNNVHTNKLLASHITQANDEAIFICHAGTLDDANELYEAGAAYVLMPHFIGDEHINQFLQRHGNNKQAFTAYRKKHLISLGDMAIKS